MSSPPSAFKSANSGGGTYWKFSRALPSARGISQRTRPSRPETRDRLGRPGTRRLGAGVVVAVDFMALGAVTNEEVRRSVWFDRVRSDRVDLREAR